MAIPAARYALSGSSGSSDGDVDGRRLLHERVDRRQHDQAWRAWRPRGRRSPRGRAAPSPRRPSPSASAIGIMPAIIAALVISTGRMRARAASMAASQRRPAAPARLLGEGHEQDRVRDGDADRHDRAHERLHVQRRPRQRPASATTPASTAGTVDTTTNASRSDWKLAASSRKITTTATTRPAAMLRERLAHRRDLAAHAHRRAARRRARARDRLDRPGRRRVPDPRRRRSPTA